MRIKAPARELDQKILRTIHVYLSYECPENHASYPQNKNGVLVEVTIRTIGARALMVPGPNPRKFNEIVLGVMGRALEVSPLELCAAVWMVNHAHLLVVVHDQQTLSRFMQHLSANISKEIGSRMRDWRGCFWERRYDGIVVSDDPADQWARLKYLLSHGTKEGLVESPLEWPGIHSARSLVHGEPLEGTWFNRSKEWAARNRGLDVGAYDFATRYQIELAPLPAHRHLTAEEYQDQIAELLEEITEEGTAARNGSPVAGIDKILGLNPYERPTRRTKRSIRPLFHAKQPDLRKQLREELKEFLAKYWHAAGALRSGKLEAAEWFPDGCYRPALPFLGEPPPRRPPSPPTRRMTLLDSGQVERGEIPIRVLTASCLAQQTVAEPRSRGRPP